MPSEAAEGTPPISALSTVMNVHWNARCDDAGVDVWFAFCRKGVVLCKGVRHGRQVQKTQMASARGTEGKQASSMQNIIQWLASCSMLMDLNIPDPSGRLICCQSGGVGAATAILAISKRSLSDSASMPRYSAISCACMLMHVLSYVI